MITTELMKSTTMLLIILLVISWMFIPSLVLPMDDVWRKVDSGLHVSEFGVPRSPAIKDSTVTVVKIDPMLYSLKLLSASEHGKVKMRVKDWCQRHNLIAGINAGMYVEDGIKNVGYMKNFDHVNNPRVNTSYKAMLAFNKLEPDVPEVQIIDLRCGDFEVWRHKYQTFVQGIRMISCRQESVWVQQPKKWSMAVLGIDKEGNVLFIFSEAPYSGYDFSNILLSLPISVHNAMYLEGGPEANLYFSAHGVEFERVGIYGTDFEDNRFRSVARPVPNVIGITKK